MYIPSPRAALLLALIAGALVVVPSQAGAAVERTSGDTYSCPTGAVCLYDDSGFRVDYDRGRLVIPIAVNRRGRVPDLGPWRLHRVISNVTSSWKNYSSIRLCAYDGSTRLWVMKRFGADDWVGPDANDKLDMVKRC